MGQTLVVVSDTSAIIDLQIAGLLEALPLLPYTIVIPAPLFETELLEFTDDEKSDLLRMGFEVRHLPGEGVIKATGYFQSHAALSINDCFALTITEDTPDALLLTGDRKLRRVADEKRVETRGVLWAIAELHDKGIRSSQTVRQSLEALMEDNSVFIPDKLIQRMLNSL